MRKHAFDLNDQTGKKTKLTLWYTPGNDTYGLLTKKQADGASVNKLMDGDSAGLSFSQQADAKRTKSGRRMGMAPGLWLLV